MRQRIRARHLSAVLTILLAAPMHAQQPGTLVADLLTDIQEVQRKLTSLAQAIPADRWSWRPGQGVRSVGEVYLHVAADNYLLPTGLGTPAPAGTGIVGSDYATVQAFERKSLPKDATVAELERSFAHLRRSMEAVSSAPMTGTVTMFGQEFSRQGFLILTTTHLHEHLGQLIAYARSLGVVPPWSQGG